MATAKTSQRTPKTSTITKLKAKKRFRLTDDDFEALCPIEGEDGAETAKYSMWAVLQLGAALQAHLDYDDVISGKQALQKYGITSPQLGSLKVVARMTNPAFGSRINYYRLSEIEAIASSEQSEDDDGDGQPSPDDENKPEGQDESGHKGPENEPKDHAPDIRNYFRSCKGAATASTSTRSQKK